MRIAAVIAEYNPFHNGHALHLQKTREAGADAVAA
ncbi:MAG: nucleotidyltransferase family protein, partial [Clostridia bacterium]|nr:nucleotidyltransferase family protein [Clostridia bacterium]